MKRAQTVNAGLRNYSRADWLDSFNVELRRNTSKHGFDVSRSSDNVPASRSHVGCFLKVLIRMPSTAPTNLRIFWWVSLLAYAETVPVKTYPL